MLRFQWKFYEEFCERINTVQKLQKDESLPFRVRCLLKDVLDNRAEKWRKKFAANKEGPTRLSELHQQAQLEQLQQQYGMSDGRGGLGGLKGRSGFDGRGMADDNGWEMAPSTRRGIGAAKAVRCPAVHIYVGWRCAGIYCLLGGYVAYGRSNVYQLVTVSSVRGKDGFLPLISRLPV